MNIIRDWEHDGTLRVEGGFKTIDRYLELRQQANEIDIYKLHVFPAFSKKQFEEGRKRAGIGDGEKIVSIGGGMYGTEEGFRAYFDKLDEINATIAKECDAQEVYCEEYNNHEGMINPDGDEQALLLVADIFGWEVATSLKRFNAAYTINEIKERNK